MNFSNKQLNSSIGKVCLKFTQQKTGKEILLPLHPTVLEIILKNNNNFPKTLTIQNYNRDLKKIGKLCKINSVIDCKKRIGFRARNIESEKWEVLSSHVGRRSFSTNFYGKIPTPLLMEATGHSSEQMFLKYINPIDNDRLLSLSNYFEKMHIESKRLN